MLKDVRLLHTCHKQSDAATRHAGRPGPADSDADGLRSAGVLRGHGHPADRRGLLKLLRFGRHTSATYRRRPPPTAYHKPPTIANTTSRCIHQVVIPAKLRSAELDPQIAVSRENVSSLLEAGACAANAMTVRILEADHKVVILGGGPAGLSAAIYAARAAMQPLVVSKDSGQLETTSVIDNYPGYEDGAFVGMIASLGDWPPAVAARTARLGLSLSDWLAGWRASPPHTSPCPHRRARRGRDAAAPAQAGSPLRRRLQEL